jgi:hypothetical protein
MDNNTVLVLGAGFTRAIVPGAPLVRGDYGVADLCKEFASFPEARQILERAQLDALGTVDLEQLLTRLMGMPYDSLNSRHEFPLITTRLLHSVARKIEAAKAVRIDRATLGIFARAVSESGASIITFNYDDIVDQALFEIHEPDSPDPRHWHPDGGYGFFCEPSFCTITNQPMYMNECSTLLLKLHGSFNWRCRLGDSGPRAPNQILHRELWFPQTSSLRSSPAVLDRVDDYLEVDPLIVPPVLLKADLTLHPVLRLVWSRARDRLSKANRIVFLGYSFPTTDLASKTLFREGLAMRASAELEVVNIRNAESAYLEARYKDLFGLLVPSFDFSGVVDWIHRNCTSPALPAP